jgi:hypothetical protein
VADIQAGLATLEVPRVLDQLRGPVVAEAAPARKRAVAALRRMLSSPTQVGSALPGRLQGPMLPVRCCL